MDGTKLFCGARPFFCTAPISFTDDFFKVTDLSVGEAPLQHGY